MLQIPLSAIPNQELNIILNNQECTIAVYKRADYYYFDLYADNVQIVQGQLIQPRTALVQGVTTFKGNIYMVDTLNPADNQAMPDYEYFSDRFQLIYLTPDEFTVLDLRS